MKRTIRSSVGSESKFLPSLRFLLLVILVWAGSLPALPALAEEAPERVGRIAYLSGDVQFYADGDTDWSAARVNYPVTSRNSVSTGDNGRAEVRVGSTALALDGNSQIDIRVLDDAGFDAELTQGTMSLRIRNFQEGDSYRIATPAGPVVIDSAGRYRIDAWPGHAEVTVFSGRVWAEADGRNVAIEAGRAARLIERGGRTNVALSDAISTPFDEWALVRDERFRERQATRYVSEEMTGYEELDDHGRWATDATYGTVWYPTTVAVGWAPYRYGNWRWVSPWGWTWVDYSPWGFAPFHYGRWVMIGGRWGWCPGGYIARPAYAPALVGFVGGSHWSVSFSFGSGPAIGWYPLSPWDRYEPHYRHRATYLTKVNNIVIVNPRGGRWDRDRDHDRHGRDWEEQGRWGHDRNRDRDRNWDRFREEASRINRTRGATVVPRDAFTGSRPVWREVARVPQRELERQQLVRADELPRAPGRGNNVSRRDESPRAISRQPFERQSGSTENRPAAHPSARPSARSESRQDARPEAGSEIRPEARPELRRELHDGRQMNRQTDRQTLRQPERASERQLERQPERQDSREVQRSMPQFERRAVDPPAPRLERQVPERSPRTDRSSAVERPAMNLSRRPERTMQNERLERLQRPEQPERNVRTGSDQFSRDLAPRGFERTQRIERPQPNERVRDTSRGIERGVERSSGRQTFERPPIERRSVERPSVERSRNIQPRQEIQRPQRLEGQVERQAERQVQRSQPRAQSSERTGGGGRFNFEGSRSMR